MNPVYLQFLLMHVKKRNEKYFFNLLENGTHACDRNEQWWACRVKNQRVQVAFHTQAKLSAINPIWNRYKSYIGLPCKSYIENGKPGIRADFLYRICIQFFYNIFCGGKNLRKKLIWWKKHFLKIFGEMFFSSKLQNFACVLGRLHGTKKTQIRSKSHPDRVKNVRVNGTHKTYPTSMWDQSESLLQPSKCVGSIEIWSGFFAV
jgi:hypothetical protein